MKLYRSKFAINPTFLNNKSNQTWPHCFNGNRADWGGVIGIVIECCILNQSIIYLHMIQYSAKCYITAKGMSLNFEVWSVIWIRLQITHGLGIPWLPMENPLWVVFVKIPAKLIYNCRSHAKGDSQKFEIEELWNTDRKS